MSARIALAAGLFALAAAAAPAQQPKKGTVPPKKDAPPKVDPARVAAAQKALTGVGCQLTPETDRRNPLFGQTKQVSFPPAATDDAFAAAVPHLLALPGLTALDLGNSQVTDAGTAHLAKLPKLEALYLDGLRIGPKTLEVVAGLGDLHWLVLSGRGKAGGGGFAAGKADLALLGKMAGLQHLEITLAPTLAAADLEPFNGLTGLRELSVTGGGRVGPEGVRHLTAPRQLTSLSLYSIPVGDEEAKVISEVAGLKSLYYVPARAGAGRLTDAGVQALTKLRSLSGLYVSGTDITLAGVTGFGEMKGLTHVVLEDCPVADEGLKRVTAAPGLTSIKVSGTPATFEGVTGLGKLTRLASLDVADTPLSDEGLKKVVEATSLASLHLSGTKATFEGVAGLNKLTKLVTLDVTNTPVSDTGLKALATLPAVQTLTLSKTAVTDAGLKLLPKLRTLTTLTLSDGGGETAAAKGLTGDGLKNLAGSGVRSLTVHAKITGADLKGLAGCKNLTTLEINDTLTDDAALKGLTGVRTLRDVWAVDTKATAAGKAAVERAVPGCVVHLEYAKGADGAGVRTPGARTTSP